MEEGKISYSSRIIPDAGKSGRKGVISNRVFLFIFLKKKSRVVFHPLK
jgi:hypothetical protein